jgi:hypothetical protein
MQRLVVDDRGVHLHILGTTQSLTWAEVQRASLPKSRRRTANRVHIVHSSHRALQPMTFQADSPQVAAAAHAEINARRQGLPPRRHAPTRSPAQTPHTPALTAREAAPLTPLDGSTPTTVAEVRAPRPVEPAAAPAPSLQERTAPPVHPAAASRRPAAAVTAGGQSLVVGPRDADDAERFAAEITRQLGLSAARTPKGADGGLDLIGPAVVGEVKHHIKPVSVEALRRLMGAAIGRPGDRLFFSLNGFTRAAEAYGEEHAMALFSYKSTGQVTACSSRAAQLLAAAPSVPAAPSPPVRRRPQPAASPRKLVVTPPVHYPVDTSPFGRLEAAQKAFARIRAEQRRIKRDPRARWWEHTAMKRASALKPDIDRTVADISWLLANPLTGRQRRKLDRLLTRLEGHATALNKVFRLP